MFVVIVIIVIIKVINHQLFIMVVLDTEEDEGRDSSQLKSNKKCNTCLLRRFDVMFVMFVLKD